MDGQLYKPRGTCVTLRTIDNSTFSDDHIHSVCTCVSFITPCVNKNGEKKSKEKSNKYHFVSRANFYIHLFFFKKAEDNYFLWGYGNMHCQHKYACTFQTC
jgi:hypothetical protein